MKDIYPIVVPVEYFGLPAAAREAGAHGVDAFGVVRPLGNDVFSLLVRADGDVIRNVHDEELAALGLDRAAAERMAIANLSSLASSSESILRQVNRTPSGFHFAVWLGDRFTSSCILWPGLYEWARRELATDEVIVMAPQVELLCVAARGDPEFRNAMKGYMEKVVSGMEKQISSEWFELTAKGIAPLGIE